MGGNDPSAASSGGGVGALLDLLGGRGEEPPPLEGVVAIPTPSGGRLCPICGRHISNPSNLRKHMHRAHGTRSYSCPACHKAYRVACDLRRHALAAHNIRMDSHQPSGGTSPPALTRHHHHHHHQGTLRSAPTNQELTVDHVALVGDADPLHLSPDTAPRTPTPDVPPAAHITPSNPPARALATHLPHPPTLPDTGTRPAARV